MERGGSTRSVQSGPDCSLDVFKVDTMVECPCVYKGKLCCKLAETFGDCICRQFLLFHGKSFLEVSENAWERALASALEGMSYTFLGIGALMGESICEGEYYLYTIFIRVENSEDRSKILDIFDGHTIHAESDGFVDGYSIGCFLGIQDCCVEVFLVQFRLWREGNSDSIFGNAAFGNKSLRSGYCIYSVVMLRY